MTLLTAFALAIALLVVVDVLGRWVDNGPRVHVLHSEPLPPDFEPPSASLLPPSD